MARLRRLVVGTLAGLGLGLLVAGVVPLAEELIKSLGVPFNAAVQGRLTRAQAFAFGVMAGAGFSFAEALVYGAQQLPHNWAQGVGLRAPALGLGLVAIEVPTMDDVSAAADRLRAKGLRVRADQGAIEVDDPWVNLVRIAAKAG